MRTTKDALLGRAPRGGVRRGATAGCALAAVFLIAAPGVMSAQQTSNPRPNAGTAGAGTTGVAPRWQAPIGHRQPTLRDLPGAVRNDEGTATKAERDLDARLRICRNC